MGRLINPESNSSTKVDAMNVYEKIKDVWSQYQEDFEERLREWADNLRGKREEVRRNRVQFRAWKPLEVYVSHSLVKQGGFSIRFLGQEVAQLKILKGKKTLIIKEKHRHKKDHFDSKGFKPGKFSWEEARQFRRHFKKLSDSEEELKPGIGEHKLEWLFLREMSKQSRKKFAGKLSLIQPVKIARCFLQMPLPIKGSSGNPQRGDGHIDILARRRRKDGKVVLSLWELKDVGKLANAVRQAYIYALTLLMMLRSPSGQKWYNIFGFKGKIPEKLDVEAVVAVSKSQKDKLLKAVEQAKNEMPLDVKEGKVKLYACYYEPPPEKGIPEQSRPN